MTDRAFQTSARGELREELLLNVRVGLRQIINPETGTEFTETEIAIATARLSNWWTEAEALDLLLLAIGDARAIYIADQVRIETSSTVWLETFHMRMWALTRLKAAGGSGPALAPCTVGTAWVGSTTVPDPAAHVGTAPDGKRFQVLFSVIAGSAGAALQLVGVDTGAETNLEVGTLIKWSNPPLGSTGDAAVTEDFRGGIPDESDADAAKRLLSRIRHKPASGNSAHYRAWSRDASSAVFDACIYACAFHAGSLLVAVLQKRSTALGPLARVASVGTLAAVTAYVTPPGSPVAPAPAHVVVVPIVATATDLVMSLAFPKGRSSGWDDLQPWPSQLAGVGAAITVVTDQLHFRMSSPVALPSGVTAPKLMVWDASQSRFTQLLVTSVTDFGGGLYDVILSAAPAAPLVRTTEASTPTTLAVGQRISPYTQRLKVIGETIDAFFDSLGPGEVVDLATDLRAHRAFRFPEPSEELPQRAGSSVLTYLRDALGAALADSTLDAITLTTPAVPADPVLGPGHLVAGKIGVYPLT